MAQYCIIQFLGMGTILILTYKFAGDYEDGLTMFAWSYGNLSTDNIARLVPVAGCWWTVASSVWFVLYKQKKMKEYKVDTAEGSAHTSKRTLWVTGLSGVATEEKMMEYFDTNYAGQVKHCKIVWDVNLLGHNIRAQRRIITKLNALDASLAESGNPKTAAKIDQMTAELAELERAEPGLRSRKTRCAGSAFITFDDSSNAYEFRSQLMSGTQPTDERLTTAVWSSKMAPRPAEMYWENFGVAAAEQRNNMLKSIASTMGMYVVFICVSLGAVWCIGFDYMYFLYAMPATQSIIDLICPQKLAVGHYVWYGIFALTFVILFLVLEEEMAPIVKYIAKFESPLTKSIKQSSYLGKCYWFYVIYHMVLSTTVLGWLANNVEVDPKMHINSRQGAIKLYVEAIGAFHQHRVFLTVGVIDMIHMLEGLKYFTRAGHTLTVVEEDEFTSAEDEEENDKKHSDGNDVFYHDKFDFSRNYGETIGVFTSMCCE